MSKNNPTARRLVLQQLAAISLGIGVLPLMSFQSVEKEKVKNFETKPSNPFYLPPPNTPLENGSMGLNIRTLIRNAQTNGQFSCVENYIAPMQMGPAPHTHEKLDEMMYVTEGTVSWLVGDQVYQVEAGGWIFRPHGIIHTFWNATNKPARAIDMFFHQNLEDYLEILFNEIFADMIKGHLTPADPNIAERMNNLNKEFGITMFPEKRQAIIDKYGLKS